MTITGDRLTHPRRNTNRHSAPPGSLNMEHILSSQSRKKSANQRPVLAGADQSEPAAIRRSSSDRFHGDKKGSYELGGSQKVISSSEKVFDPLKLLRLKPSTDVHNILLNY